MIIYLADLTRIIKDFGFPRSEVISKKILSKELGVPFQNIRIKKGVFGKPFLEGGERHFNISYSKNMLLIATDNTPIGVDIEYVKEIREIDSLVQHFYSKEKHSFYKTKNSEKLQFFYRLWVLKESYIKAIGKGLSCSLDSFYIHMDKTGASLICSEEKDIDWKFKIYSLSKGYVLAICAKHNRFPKKFIDLDINDLLDL